MRWNQYLLKSDHLLGMKFYIVNMIVSSKLLATKRIYFTPLKREYFLFIPSWISMTLKEAKIHNDRMCLKEVLDIICYLNT